MFENLFKNPMAKGLIKQFIPQVKEMLPGLNTVVAKILADKPLQDGESKAVFMLIPDDNGILHVFTVALDADDNAIRIIEKRVLTEFVESLLDQGIKL